MRKLAIVTSHPIQYNAPWFALLNKNNKVKAKIFYTWEQSQQGEKYDPGFQQPVKWDLPLLDGYEYRFVKNIAPDPGTHHFKGLINPSLNKEIEQWKPDAVLVFGWSFVSHLKCIRYFHKKIPVLFRGDSTLLDEKKNVRTFFRRIFLNWVYKHIDFALYTGTHNKKYFLKHGLKERQLLYAPHAVDNDRFTNGQELYERQAEQLRQQLGIQPGDIVLLFAGKLEQKKNPIFLLKLLKQNSSSRLKVLFVGNGQLRDELKMEAAHDNRVLFMDFQNQSQMPVVYRMGDIFILPSTGPGETWGLALNEAMACGKPVIVSEKAGAAIDLIKEGENGLIINLSNSKNTEDLLERVLQDKTLLTKMGNSSLAIIEQFKYNHIVDQIVSIMDKIKVKASFTYFLVLSCLVQCIPYQ